MTQTSADNFLDDDYSPRDLPVGDPTAYEEYMNGPKSDAGDIFDRPDFLLMTAQNKLRKSAQTYLKMVRSKTFDARETAKYLREVYQEFGQKTARAEIERQKA